MDEQYNKQDNNQESQLTSGDAVFEAVPKYAPYASKRFPFEEGKRYTYADYCTWDDQIDGKPVRYELIDGIPFVMSSPGRRHQKISMELSVQFSNFLKGKPCEVYAAPFDVRINPEGADDTVLQPDILIICDHTKLTDAGCIGSPDMVIEILSPTSIQHDRLRKLGLYEKYGVREYWIVEPDSESITVYILENGKYILMDYSGEKVIPVHVLEGCEIDLAEVFAG